MLQGLRGCLGSGGEVLVGNIRNGLVAMVWVAVQKMCGELVLVHPIGSASGKTTRGLTWEVGDDDSQFGGCHWDRGGCGRNHQQEQLWRDRWIHVEDQLPGWHKMQSGAWPNCMASVAAIGVWPG